MSVVRFFPPSCLPSVPSPPPLLALYSAETPYLGGRTGKIYLYASARLLVKQLWIYLLNHHLLSHREHHQ